MSVSHNSSPYRSTPSQPRQIVTPPQLRARFDEFCFAVRLVDGGYSNRRFDRRDIRLEKEDEPAFRFADERPVGFLVDDVDVNGITWFGLSTERFPTPPAVGIVLRRSFRSVACPATRRITANKRIVLPRLIASHGAIDTTSS